MTVPEAGSPSRSLLGRTGVVGVGVVVGGLGTVAMLAVAARMTPPDVFATLATWWVLATLVVYPFGVFETYLARLVVADRARGADPRGSLATMTGRAALVAGGVAGVAAALDPLLSGGLFRGASGLGVLLGVYCLIGMLQSLARGYAAGHGRFGVVGAQLSGDGVGRASALAVAVVVAPGDVRIQAVALCVGAALSLPVAAVGLPAWRTRPRLRDAGIGQREVAALLVGALGPILVNNLSVPWLSHHEPDAVLVGAFSGVLTLSRIPLQLASAAFGPLLTQVSQLVERRETVALDALTLRAGALAGTTAALFVGGFVLLGPWALGIFLGEVYRLPRGVFLGLGAATGLMLVAIVVQSRAAGEQQWLSLAGSWALAAVAFVVVLPLPASALAGATLAPAVASSAGLAALVTVVWRRRGRPRRATPHTAPR